MDKNNFKLKWKYTTKVIWNKKKYKNSKYVYPTLQTSIPRELIKFLHSIYSPEDPNYIFFYKNLDNSISIVTKEPVGYEYKKRKYQGIPSGLFVRLPLKLFDNFIKELLIPNQKYLYDITLLLDLSKKEEVTQTYGKLYISINPIK